MVHRKRYVDRLDETDQDESLQALSKFVWSFAQSMQIAYSETIGILGLLLSPGDRLMLIWETV